MSEKKKRDARYLAGRGLKQSEIADQLGVHQSTICRWLREDGRRFRHVRARKTDRWREMYEGAEERLEHSREKWRSERASMQSQIDALKAQVAELRSYNMQAQHDLEKFRRQASTVRRTKEWKMGRIFIRMLMGLMTEGEWTESLLTREVVSVYNPDAPPLPLSDEQIKVLNYYRERWEATVHRALGNQLRSVIAEEGHARGWCSKKGNAREGHKKDMRQLRQDMIDDAFEALRHEDPFAVELVDHMRRYGGRHGE